MKNKLKYLGYNIIILIIGGFFMYQSDCVFCKIIKGEIPATTIYEDDDFKAFLDISPASKGHTVIIPKKHIADIFEMDDSTSQKIFKVVTKISKAMKEELNFDGLNILQNNGQAAGQTVFHFHIHLIPRYENDDIRLGWKPEKVDFSEITKIAENIKIRL